MPVRDHRSLHALEAGGDQRAGRDQGHAAGQAEAEGRFADHRPVYEGVAGADRVHDPRTGQVARRELDTAKTVDFADAEPSAFASMLGGLIEANVDSRAERRRDFDALAARVGIWVTDIDDGVTVYFQPGRLVFHNGLQLRRDFTFLAVDCTELRHSKL